MTYLRSQLRGSQAGRIIYRGKVLSTERLCDVQGLEDGQTVHYVPRRNSEPVGEVSIHKEEEEQEEEQGNPDGDSATPSSLPATIGLLSPLLAGLQSRRALGGGGPSQPPLPTPLSIAQVRSEVMHARVHICAFMSNSICVCSPSPPSTPCPTQPTSQAR